MALKFTRKPSDYFSETAYVYDVAQTSPYFDKSVYEGLASLGDEDAIQQYIYGIAGAKDKTLSSFNQNDYNYLSVEDKATYMLWNLYGDKNETAVDEETGQTYNVWDATKQYFDYQVQSAIDKEVWDSMSEFEKVMNTIGGVIGNSFSAVYGMAENIIDLFVLGIGGVASEIVPLVGGDKEEAWKTVKETAAWDVTGAGALQDSLNEFTNKKTYIGKNQIVSGINDVVSGISQYAVNFIPYVGPAIYWMSTAGSFATEALESNPNIDFWSLAGYTAGGTALAVGIEKISGKLLGGKGSFIDELTLGAKKGAATAVGKQAAKSWVTKVLGDFLSEGLEEAIEEFADTVLFNALVAQGDERLRKDYSIYDVLYAGIIGGLIGGIMSGGKIAATRAQVITADGQLVSKKYAQENNLEIKQELTKMQTININEGLAELSRLSQTSAVADLRTKYGGESLETIQKEHIDEYEKALAKDKKITDKMVQALVTIAEIHGILGDENFKKVTDLASATYETVQRYADNYEAKLTGKTIENRRVESAVKQIYGNHVSFKVSDSLTPEQQRLKQNLYNNFGIKCYFGSVGKIGDGTKLGLTISEYTIIIDPKVFGEMSQQEILNTVVKEEIVHTLQFQGSIITPQMLVTIQVAMGKVNPNANITPQDLNEAYKDADTLTKLTEAQAKAVAEVLLIDELTVSKMFYTQYSTFGKFYRVLNGMKNLLERNPKELKTQKGKVKYNKLLKAMRMYNDIAAKKLGTEANLEKYRKEFKISDEDFDRLRNTYLADPNVPAIVGNEFLLSAAFAREPDTTQLYDSLVKNLQEKEYQKYEKDILAYLNDYLSKADVQMTIKKVADAYFVSRVDTTAKKPRAVTFTTADSLSELITELRTKDVITDEVITNIDNLIQDRELVPQTIAPEEGQVSLVTGQYETVKPTNTSGKNKNKTVLGYVQPTIFDYIEESFTEEQANKTIENAGKQEAEALDKIEKLDKTELENKAAKITDLCKTFTKSEFQGVDNAEFVSWSNDQYVDHADVFENLTFEECWALFNRFLVRMPIDPIQGTATNAVLRYMWLQKDTKFKDNRDLINTIYARTISFGAQTIALTSSDYDTTVKNFIRQLAMEKGVTDIPLPTEYFTQLIPNFDEEFKDLDGFKKSIEKDINSIDKQLQEKKLDALDRVDLARQKAYKQSILAMLNDGDVASAIDYQLKSMFESGENITDVLQRQSAVYNAIIEYLITHANFDENGFANFSSKKIPLSKNAERAKNFFMGLESFRYLMMLSNPATAIKNFASNTLVYGQALIEDLALKFYENRNIMTEATQGRFTGNYNDEFKKYVRETYWAMIKEHAKGDKYTSTELQRLQQQYAEAKDPLKKSKLLALIQKAEKRALSDELFTSNRTLLNLTNMLAGTSDIILSQSIDYLKSKYHAQGVKWSSFKNTADDISKMQKTLIDTISKTNKNVADLLTKAIGGDKVSVIKLARQLKLPIVDADLKNQNTIYYSAFKRANKLFFKVDNWLSTMMNKLNKNHPYMAYVVRHIVPFVRVAANTTQYIIDRSPIGLLNGIRNMLKTKHQWAYEMRREIDKYYKAKYVELKSATVKDFEFKPEEYSKWLKNLSDNDAGLSSSLLRQALSGDDKATRKIFNEMVEQAWVSKEKIGSDDLFARATALEQIAQGSVGTAVMILGMLAAAIFDFEYDEDEYLGPVIKGKNFKIALDELSPFTTIFSMGALLNSDVDDKFGTLFKVFADASILSTFDSALSYSDGIWDYVKNQSINIATQYQPALTKAISKIYHNKKKDKGSDYMTRLLNTMRANTIFFNWMVPDKINPYTGEPEKYYDTGFWEALGDTVLPIGLRIVDESEFETESKRLKTTTSGLSGNFTINDKDYKLTGKTKQKYASYKAKYINSRFEDILSGDEKVTIKDEKTGKYKTTTYDKLTDEEKSRVLKNLYSKGTEITKIQYWLDQGNSYYVSDKEQYWEYKDIFGSDAKIIYRKNWKKSKFVEG